MLDVLNGGYTRGILNLLDNTWGTAIAGLAAAVAIFGWLTRLTDRRRFTSALTLLIWLTLPVLAIWFVSLNRPLFTDRYVIWIMPAYYLSIALGLEAVWQLRPTRFGLARVWRTLAGTSLIVLLITGGLSISAQATTPYKSDFRSAAAAVAKSVQPNDTLVFQIPYIQTTFDYYYHQPYASLAGPYTNFPGNNDGYQDSEAAVFAQLDQVFQGKTVVWLIASEVAMWDQRNLLQRWLDAHGTVTEEDVFAQVTVTRYELR